MLTLPDKRMNVLLVGKINNKGKTINWTFYKAERKD